MSKRVRVIVIETSQLVYEVEADNEFSDFDDKVAVGDLLWWDGCSPDPISVEVQEEKIVYAWEVKVN